MSELKNLLREPLRSFKPYVAGKPIEEVRRELNLSGRIAKLASNENPLGTSPKALEAMHKAIDEVYLYPDDNAYYFRKKVAERFEVGIENVFAAAGSVEVLELAAIAFLNPGDRVVTSQRTFAIYALAAMKAGADLQMAPMIDGGFRYDLPALAALINDKTKIVFLANPTNPTGTWFTKGEFDAFMDRVPADVLVVYDSAYEEYATVDDLPDPMRHFRAGRRLLYVRTLSKAYGLAGMRIGYAIGPADMVHGLMTCRVPFNASLVAQVGAMAAMDDLEFVHKSRDFNAGEIQFLRDGLKDLPVVVPPSQTNFVLIDTKKDANWLFVELQKKGIIVRPMAAAGMPGAIRVSPGLREDNERFVKHLRELLAS
ncbi:MAG: histidinol-phosphate transaminase [Deltaproteobacteria bacterium]|nr:histidinol-phosphate transaminase [Deltaproteobacteria bacterium]